MIEKPEPLDSSETIGALILAAILRGYARASLKHRIKVLDGTVWEKIISAMPSSSENGSAGRKLWDAVSGIRLPGFSEEDSRRRIFGLIVHWDPVVEDWLDADPKFAHRRNLKFRSMEDVMGQFEDTKWLWKNWIPRGYVSLFVGRSGAGKSWVALWLANKILSGQVMPDGQPAPEEPRDNDRIVWIETEASQSLTAQRLRALHAPAAKFVWPLDPKDPDNEFPLVRLDDRRWFEIIADFCFQHKPKWVVVDSLRGSHGLDENSSEIQTMLGVAGVIARDVGCGFTFIHHLRKAKANEQANVVSLEMIRGSTAIPAAPRHIFAVDMPDPFRPKDLRMHVIKSNLCEFPDAIGIAIDASGPNTLTDVPEIPRNLRPIDLAVDFLREFLLDGPRTQTDVLEQAAQQGIRPSTLRRARLKIGVVVVQIERHWEWSLRSGRDIPYRKDHDV